MSHTIGQVKQDNQQSNSNSSQANQGSAKLEDNTLKSTSGLSDADYEFLFNQLLEGITHGWHDRRIAKFFKQLGDRAQQADWVAWLDRFQGEVSSLPVQSKRQLGTTMIRLGELTQSITEISQIAAASYRIGRELLLGNSPAVIWEYVGPDLALNPTKLKPKEPEFSSEPLAQLSETSINKVVTPDALEPTDKNSDDTAAKSLTEAEVAIPERNLNSTDLTKTINYSNSKKIDEFKSIHQSTETVNIAKIASSGGNKPVERAKKTSAVKSESNLPLEAKKKLSELAEDSDSYESNVSSSVKYLDLKDNDPLAIDMQQLMQLIQEDQELAQQISQKLNPSLVKPEITKAELNELDRSTLELIESWFELGLKQVSAGEFRQAIASWEKVLNINPNLSEAWHNRGSALGRLGNYEAAIESFQSALTIDPHNYQAWNDRAHALYQLQNWSEAVNSWSNAIKIMPGNHLFWYNRGCALEHLEQWQDAIASYEKALEIKPDFQPGRSRYINLVADNSRSN